MAISHTPEGREDLGLHLSFSLAAREGDGANFASITSMTSSSTMNMATRIIFTIASCMFHDETALLTITYISLAFRAVVILGYWTAYGWLLRKASWKLLDPTTSVTDERFLETEPLGRLQGLFYAIVRDELEPVTLQETDETLAQVGVTSKTACCNTRDSFFISRVVQPSSSAV